MDKEKEIEYVKKAIEETKERIEQDQQTIKVLQAWLDGEDMVKAMQE